MRIKITDGGLTGKGVEVVNAETGEKLEYVRRAKINLAAGEINTAELEFVASEVDVVVLAKLARDSKKFLNNIRKEMEKVEREESE